ncbi:hypothetical protein EDC01DRAFT_783127 [Geopyxis carbonaria]|nr:hypothetical protein EDC01DRAFT_783127 [Geopyxis carbonaria]
MRDAIRAAFERSQAAHATASIQDTQMGQTSPVTPAAGASDNFLAADAPDPYQIAAPAYHADTSISPQHRRLFQAVIVACHLRLRASWGEACATMHPPAIGRWSRAAVASGLRQFEASEAAGGRESVLSGLALNLLEDPMDQGVEILLIGMLGSVDGIETGSAENDEGGIGEDEDDDENAGN